MYVAVDCPLTGGSKPVNEYVTLEFCGFNSILISLIFIRNCINITKLRNCNDTVAFTVRC